MWRRNGYQRSSHVEPKHNELFGSTYLQPLLPDHILLEILATVGRFYEFQQDWWVFSWTFWRLVFWWFFSVGTVMPYTYSKWESLVVMWQNCIAAFIQCKLKKEWLWRANIIICSFFSALKIKFLFSGTFPSYRLPSSLEKKQIKLSWQYKKK